MIDLHLHTTASDGRSSPEQLVRRTTRAGLKTISVTDHDTTAGIARAADAARTLGVRVVPGIEITAVHDGLDVHMLGYFFDPAHAELTGFLDDQRADRRRRVEEMLDRLAQLGAPLDRGQVLKQASKMTGKALGRPVLARALVAAGHARDISDAFERFLGAGRPAFIARRGSTPAEVVALVGRAGGVSSLAHPGKLGLDALVAPLAAAGLTAIEVFHPDHDQVAIERYSALAHEHGLARSGGSDYHGPKSGRTEALGSVTLPESVFDELSRRAPIVRFA